MQYDRSYFQGRRSFFYSLGGYRDVGVYFDRLAGWFRPHAGTGPLLDIGCAYGFLLARFNDGRDLRGCDVSSWAIEQASLRVPKARFDVLEHIAPEGQVRLLAEVARILVPGGRFCMTSPNLCILRRTVYFGADRRESHIGMRSLGDWKQELRRRNLYTVASWTFLHGFLPGRFTSSWMPECALVATRAA
jgi:SAM-dependent methyltransferase